MSDDHTMRTTLDLDDDVLQAAKELAACQRKTAGQVLSELARKALSPERPDVKVRNGVPLLPSIPGRIMTVKMVEDLLDETEG
jgi:hypothetical protein